MTTAQMRDVDRIMADELGIGLELMMENAGRQLASVVRDHEPVGTTRGPRVVVLAGRGGNGGGALVAARRLRGWGCQVHVVLNASVTELSSVTRAQLGRALAVGATATVGLDHDGWGRPHAIIDGLIGYSLKGPPDERTAALIHAANRDPAPTIALDVPSGLDATTGDAADPTIRAAITMTLALPKVGLANPSAAAFAGSVVLADIGVPSVALDRAGISTPSGPVFAERDLFVVR